MNRVNWIEWGESSWASRVFKYIWINFGKLNGNCAVNVCCLLLSGFTTNCGTLSVSPSLSSSQAEARLWMSQMKKLWTVCTIGVRAGRGREVWGEGGEEALLIVVIVIACSATVTNNNDNNYNKKWATTVVSIIFMSWHFIFNFSSLLLAVSWNKANIHIHTYIHMCTYRKGARNLQ